MVFEGYIEIFTEYSPLLLEGIKNTLLLTIVSFTIGFVLGLPTAVTRVYAPRPLRWLAVIYVELIRGTPMIVQLFLVYFALPQLGITLDPLTAAFLG
ncbi:MAG: amino acid ABC transporter permease, partial [Thermoprotei archaeon]